MNQHIESKNIVSEFNSIISSFSDNWNGNYKNLSKFFNKFKISSTVDIDIINSYNTVIC